MNIESKMIFRSFMAYCDFWETKVPVLENNVTNALNSVKNELEFDSICWGPVAHKGHDFFSDCLVYILKEKEDEFTIVIRGTNPVSISSWIFQDLNVSGMTPWSRQSPNTESNNGYISKATDTSLEIIKSLIPSGKTILNWLKDTVNEKEPKNKITLNVTGHSLGGLMCGTFAYYLMDELKKDSLRDYVTCNVYGFAGPTAGNSQYVQNLAKSLDSFFCYENHYDIATHVWNENNMKALPELYKPKIVMKEFESKLLKSFIKQITSLNYTQPSKVIPIKAHVTPFCPGEDYFIQGAYQHVVPYLLWGIEKALIDYVEELLPSPLEKIVDILIIILKHLIKNDEAISSLIGNSVEEGEKEQLLSYACNQLKSCIN